jgi:hypothetical protein
MTRPLARRLAVAALTTLCVVAGAAQARASTRIINQGNGLALGVMYNGAAVNGAYLALQPYDGRATQKWFVEHESVAGYVSLRNSANTGLCANYDNGPLRLGPCQDGIAGPSWLYLRSEPAGGSSIRLAYDQWPFGDLYANAFITDDGPRPPSAWYRFNFVNDPLPPPEPGDPMPPVCHSKPSLPQCN